jgi:hypothetical protein
MLQAHQDPDTLLQLVDVVLFEPGPRSHTGDGFALSEAERIERRKALQYLHICARFAKSRECPVPPVGSTFSSNLPASMSSMTRTITFNDGNRVSQRLR